MKLGGFFQSDSSITQAVHQQAVDIAPPVPQWYEWCFIPFVDSEKRKWTVDKVNVVDKNAGNVMYSVIRSKELDKWVGYFHTAECPYQIGDELWSGDFFCKIAPSGKYNGPHLHPSIRTYRQGNLGNLYDYLDWYPGGKYGLGVVKGKDNYIKPEPEKDIAQQLQVQNDIIKNATIETDKLIQLLNGKN